MSRIDLKNRRGKLVKGRIRTARKRKSTTGRSPRSATPFPGAFHECKICGRPLMYGKKKCPWCGGMV